MRKAIRILAIMNAILIASVLLLIGLNFVLLMRYSYFSLIAFALLDISILISIPINSAYKLLIKHKNKYHG